MNINYPSPFSDSDETIEGLGLGLRIGGHVADMFFVAFDGRYSKPSYTSSAVNGKADAIHTNYGATVGAQTPFLGLRVWGTYIIDGSLDPDRVNNVNVKFTKFKGYRIGAGLFFAIVSINYEYQEAKYGKASLEEIGPFSNVGVLDTVDATDKRHIVSVSFPLRF